MGWLEAHQRRRFWMDTFRHDGFTVYVEYAYGMLVPTVYVPGGGRRYPPAVLASRFAGPNAEDLRSWEMGLITSALGSAAGSASGQPAADPEMEKRTPTVHAFMTQLQEDGKERTPSSLVIFTEDGEWKVCLTEKDQNLKLWRSGETLGKALLSLEKALASGSADWRKGFDPAKQGKGKKGK